jgi:hypothetical protein
MALQKKKSKIKVAFVSRKVIFEKLLSKLSCVCLLIEKLVNRKHFLEVVKI